jgi:hypothetical protein
MKIEEFEDCVDRFGEDVASWPSPERERGRALLATSTAAQGVVSQAKLLRAAISSAAPVRAPAGLADRIMAKAVAARPAAVAVSPERSVGRFGDLFGFAGAMRPAVVLSFCFLVGLVAAWLPPVSPTSGLTLDVSMLLTGMVE